MSELDRQVHPAAFTMTFRDVLEMHGATLGIENGLGTITGGDDMIPLKHYPIFDEDYRATLNGKIVDHFYNREIGQESDSLFFLSLRRKLNEIMPLYNLRYESTKIEFDPLSTINLSTVSSGTTNQTATEHAENDTTSDGTSHSRSVASETPQTMLSGDEDYASSASDANSQSANTANATTDSNTTGQVDSSGQTTQTGYQGLTSDMILRYRQTLINVDLEILDELEGLFMGVWDTGDSYGAQSPTFYGYGPFGFMPWY